MSASETWMKHKADHISMYWHLITLPYHLHACVADVRVTLLLPFFIRHTCIIFMGRLGFHCKQVSLYELCDDCMWNTAYCMCRTRNYIYVQWKKWTWDGEVFIMKKRRQTLRTFILECKSECTDCLVSERLFALVNII